jgi:Ca-activated chloride channel homolog
MKKQWLIALCVVLLAGVAGVVRLSAAKSESRPVFSGRRSPEIKRRAVRAKKEYPNAGELRALAGTGRPETACPLERTAVDVEISGFLARTTVTQTFSNPFSDPIEAVYAFPLSQNGAVDTMTMRVGDRTIRGDIRRRSEARQRYDSARRQGYTASLLDQERPNIFTQSVANIPPRQKVEITISYVETVGYENGRYEYVFPMVVGPRYTPVEVPDAARIPAASPPATRNGNEIRMHVVLDAGVPVYGLGSPTHQVGIIRHSASEARIALERLDSIPNQDFILDYEVAGDTVTDALFTHRDSRGGFFTLMLQPPQRIAEPDVTPKELVFVLDTSGSMSGFPIEKARACMEMALVELHERDTFNIITFAGNTEILFPEPVPATSENLAVARAFLRTQRSGGGTKMMDAIQAALAPSDTGDHIRVVCFMTDGFVGNDQEIIAEVKRHPNARVFSFGIGGSVNRFLLDKLAEAGRGEVEYVGLGDDGDAAAVRFHERVRTPLLTDVEIDWGGLPVTDLMPTRLPDLFSARPLIITGRYSGPAEGFITLKGTQAGRSFERRLAVKFPEQKERHDALASLWARRKIDALMSEDFDGAQRGRMRADLEEEITRLGLDYRLMTRFTSFVAVDDRGRETGDDFASDQRSRSADAPGTVTRSGSNRFSGVVGGVPGGIPGNSSGGAPPPPPEAPKQETAVPSGPVRRSEGVMRGNAIERVSPTYPSIAKQVGVQGDVVVEVLIDEQGRIESATVLSGPALLQQAALVAVRRWTFRPTIRNGIPVRTTGVMTFRFNLDGPSAPGSKLAEEIEQYLQVRTAGRVQPTPDFVSGDDLSLVIVMNDLSRSTLAAMEAAGFHITRSDSRSKTATGRIVSSRLKDLAALPDVRFIAPGRK